MCPHDAVVAPPTPPRPAKAAGGAAGAALDFAQVHSYATDGGRFNPTSPFKHAAGAYGLAPRPLLVGEFSPGKMAAGETATQLYGWAHAHGYAGAWGYAVLRAWNLRAVAPVSVRPSPTALRRPPRLPACSRWTATSAPSLFGGMESLRHDKDVAVVALPHTGAPDTCACSDVPPPPGQYTCQQQAGWGKCSASFMAGYCCRSCHACSKDCTRLGGLVEGGGAPTSQPPAWQPDWPHEAYRQYVQRARASMPF